MPRTPSTRWALCLLSLLAILPAGGTAADEPGAPGAEAVTTMLQEALQALGSQPFYDARLTLSTNWPDGAGARTLLAEGRVQSGEVGHFKVYFAGPDGKDLEVYVRGRARAARIADGEGWSPASGKNGPGLLPLFRFPAELWAAMAETAQSCVPAGTQVLAGRDCQAIKVELRPEAVADLVAAWKSPQKLDPGSVEASLRFLVDKSAGRLRAAWLEVTASRGSAPGGGGDRVAPRYILQIVLPVRPWEQPFTVPPDAARAMR